MLQHYLNGIQFALGDLQLDTVPSATVDKSLTAAPAPDIMALLNPPPPKPNPAVIPAATSNITNPVPAAK